MHAIVMAGGSGTRFWPSSRKDRPKQFLCITGEKSMIEETCNRLAPIAKDEEIAIILGKDHLREASEIFRDREIKILAEPVGRNTAPCIGLGALYAKHSGCKGPVAFLPADHFIGDTASFLNCLQHAGNAAESGGIVTLGIVPTRPETGYGYIHRSKSRIDSFESPLYEVLAFVEKPDSDTAREYLTNGEYFWNAGIFVATPETILQEVEKHMPDLYKGLMQLENSFEEDSFEESFSRVYDNLESVSFDYGIMEKTKAPVYVVPCECGWSDVGSWASLHELRECNQDDSRNISEGEALLVDCKNSYISAMAGKMVACLGIEDLIVVDTQDAVLVADIQRSQDIKLIVEKLKSMKKENLL